MIPTHAPKESTRWEKRKQKWQAMKEQKLKIVQISGYTFGVREMNGRGDSMLVSKEEASSLTNYIVSGSLIGNAVHEGLNILLTKST